MEFADAFTRADGDVGSNYTGWWGNSVPNITANACYCANTSGWDEMGRYNVASLNTRQFAQVTLATKNASDTSYKVVHLGLRIGGTDGAPNGYLFEWFIGQFGPGARILRITSGADTQIVTAGAISSYADGDVLRAEASGTVLTLMRNGETLCTYDVASDGTLYTGGGYVVLGVTDATNAMRLDDFSCGDLTAVLAGDSLGIGRVLGTTRAVAGF